MRPESRKRFAPRRTGPKGRPWRIDRRNSDAMVLYGWHSVRAALENPQRRFHRLLATENAARRLGEDNVKLALEVEVVGAEQIAVRAGPEAVHQGICAEPDPLPSPDLEAVAHGILLALDQVTDPYNVVAILRSAA